MVPKSAFTIAFLSNSDHNTKLLANSNNALKLKNLLNLTSRTSYHGLKSNTRKIQEEAWPLYISIENHNTQTGSGKLTTGRWQTSLQMQV